MGAWYVASRRVLIVLVVVACATTGYVASASAMTFVVQGSNCSGEEGCNSTYYKGSTLSEGLQYLEFPYSYSGLALSPDGNYIAWTSPGRGLYLSDSEARSSAPLVQYEGGESLGMHWVYEEPVFAPDQGSVLFNWKAECLEEFCEPFEVTPHEEFHQASTAGQGDPRRVSPAVPREPALSSDGGRLAFVTLREGTREIWISSASGDGGTAVTTREMEFEAVASPSFAPEGNRLTFEGTPRGREPQIYVIGINGGELVQLTRSGGMKPAWSPNEAFIAYTNTSQTSIDRIDPDTGRGLSPLLGSTPEPEEVIDRVILPQADFLKSVRTFEPVLRFDSSEKWRPLNVDRFLEENQHRICDESCDEEPIATAADLARHASETSYIEQAGSLEEGIESYHSPDLGCLAGELLDCDTGTESAIYYRVTQPFFDELEVGYRYIDYWFFYRVNTFALEAIDFHEGDWEGVTIAPSPGNPETFDYAAFSQHRHFYSYLRDVLRCDETQEATEPPEAGTCGNEEARTGQRVSVMVAHGDHANYTTPCSETIVLLSCSQNGEEFERERGYDGHDRWGNAFADPYTTLLPLPPAAPNYDPTNGPDPEAWAAGQHGWADWPGTWGRPGGGVTADGPRGPLDRSLSLVCATIDNPEGMCSTGPRTATAHKHAMEAPSPGLVGLSCKSWIGTGVSAAVCEPRQLRRAIRRGRLRSQPTRRLGVVGGHGRGASAPGVVQLAGRALGNGSRLRLSRPLGPKATLLVRIHGRGRARHHIYIARFARSASAPTGRARTSVLPAAHALRLRVGVERSRHVSVRLGGVAPGSLTVVR